VTKLASGFVFGLKGSGDNVGFGLFTADSVAYGVGNEKVFIWPYGDNVARFFGNVTNLEIVSNLNDLTVYPYEAYDHIHSPHLNENNVTVYIEIIGFPMYENGTVDVNLEDGVFYKVKSFNATDLVQGYKELDIKVPTLPGGYYYAYVNESNSTSYYDYQYSSYGLNIACIIGYKVSGSSAYQMLAGKVTAKPGANVTFIGYGFDANTSVEIYSLVPSLSSPLAPTTTDDYGTFNTTLSTSYLLQLTGRNSGVFQLELYSSPCSQDFSLIISGKPQFEISVKADGNAFVGDTIFVAIKLVYVLDNQQYSVLSSNYITLEELKIWFVYGSGDVDTISISSLSNSPVVYYNNETGEIVITYTITHQPSTDGLVIDALAKASVYGLYDVYSTDHTVISVDTALSNKIISVNNTVKDEASNLGNQLSSLNANLTGVLSSLNDTVKALANDLTSKMDNSTAQILNALSSLNDNVNASANKLSDEISGVNNAVVNSNQQILNALSSLNDNVNASANKLNSKLDEMNSNIKDEITSLQSDVDNKLQTLNQKVDSAINAAQNAGTAAQSAANAAQKANQKEDAISNKVDNISAVVGGIKSNTGSLQTYAMVNAVLIIITLITAIAVLMKVRP